MKKISLTLITVVTIIQFSNAQNFTTDVTVNSSVPAGHGSGYNAIWFPNANAIMPENNPAYGNISLTSNIIRSTATGAWAFANSSLPAWRLTLGSGPNTDYFLINRSAPNSYAEISLLEITNSGNVLIGKTYQANASYKLDVNGTVRANAITVNVGGADFVFAPTYKLLTLPELNSFIQKNHHLPEIASAKEMQTNGLNVGDNQIKLLQKVEELTLYLIEKDEQLNEEKELTNKQQQQLDNQQQVNTQQENRLDTLEKEIEVMKQQMIKMAKQSNK